MVVELYPHQQKAVDEMHNGCVLLGDVGTGKTFTSLVYFYTKVCGGVMGDLGSLRTPRDLYVITTAKKRDSLDWEKDAALLAIGGESRNGVAGIQMTVDSWNNIGDYTNVKDAFFIFDEQRAVGSGSWSKAFVKIAQQNQFIMLSATPGDNWLDYIPIFLANGFYKNRTQFKREHVVYSAYSKFPKVERYTGVGTLVRHKNAVLVQMPMERHTTRKIEEICVDYDRKLFEWATTKRWNPFTDEPMKDVAELFRVMRRISNSDPSRLEAVRTLMQKHDRLIVFYNFDYELEALRSLASVEFQDATGKTQPVHIAEECDGELSEILSEAMKEMPLFAGSTSTTSKSKASQSSQTKIKSNGSEGSTPNNSSGSNASFAVAEWNGHKHQPVPTTDRWVYLVQFVAGSEGWNCITTDAMCMYSLTYSYKNWHQAFGRIDRLNTPFTTLNYYILMSQSVIDRGIGRALRSKKNFNESSFGGAKRSFEKAA